MISATLIVKNGQRCLREVLIKLSTFDEIIAIDTGSTDETKVILREFSNVHLFDSDFIGFGRLRNLAAQMAKNDWILAIDADEVLSDDLQREILALQLDAEAVYQLPFYNFFNGKWIRGCGWYPESHIRLYNRRTTSFAENLVHEGVIKKGLKVVPLKHPVHHYPYATLSDFLIKCDRYSTLFAEQNRDKKIGVFRPFVHSFWAFFKSYLIKGGWKMGFEGWIISSYQAQAAHYKYAKLYLIHKK